MFNYTLTRSKRRTIAIYVHGDTVDVRAPMRTSKREIDKFVQSKEKWISDRLEESRKLQLQREKFTLTYGDLVTYRGRKFPIVARDCKLAELDDERFYLPFNLSSEQIKLSIIQLYKTLAKRHLTSRIINFAKLMNVAPIAVKINSAKTRWGSCSGRKSINFSWRLIMADDDVIDYVTVHELAHITEMNHSPRFWKIVENILPDYKNRQLKLKQLQEVLSAQNWEYSAENDIHDEAIQVKSKHDYAACDAGFSPQGETKVKSEFEQLTLI
ncbi:MAG: M48 family metallopeptidase [Oscillospiraceae bacterium]|nr:M48 family metallopeptidase [Oscillospiraceae bacterium]